MGRKELYEVRADAGACRRLAAMFGLSACSAIAYAVREARTDQEIAAGVFAAVANARAAWRAAMLGTRDSGYHWRYPVPGGQS